MNKTQTTTSGHEPGPLERAARRSRDRAGIAPPEGTGVTAEPLSSLRMRAALDGECPVCFNPDLTAAGDTLQSAASRMAEWINKQGTEVPYEVLMATFEARTAIDKWTDARRKR